jgi:hypothetical protein
MKEQNSNTATAVKPSISLSKAALREESLKRENAKIHLVKCVGCGDESDSEHADGHLEKALVTKSEFKRIQNGKFIARCTPCKNEYLNRRKNSKTLVDFRRSVREIDNILSKATEYELEDAHIRTLTDERNFCTTEMRKALGSDEEVEKFLKA